MLVECSVLIALGEQVLGGLANILVSNFYENMLFTFKNRGA